MKIQIAAVLLFGACTQIPVHAADMSADMSATSMPMPQHSLKNASEMTWGPGPAFFPSGAQMMVLYGDPSQPGVFTVRLKSPPGYKIPLHTHPTDELVTVIDGSITLKMDTATSKGTTLTAGGFANLPAGMRHQAEFPKGGTVQVHGMGPFAIIYVNPAEDPRNQKTKQ